jgi:Flp pilus assembly protein TadG
MNGSIFLKLKRFSRDRKGVAAIEFALILPIMLMIFFGSIELTRGVLASRKTSLLARSLSDIASQQLDCSVAGGTAPCLGDNDINGLFAAATAIMSPYPAAAGLRMTISQVDIIAGNPSSKRLAFTRWSVKKGANALYRPCTAGGPSSSLNQVDINPGAPDFEKAFPTSYVANNAAIGSIIVADVSYDYKPGFSWQQNRWSDTTTQITFNQSQYMRTRNDGKQIDPQMTATNANFQFQNCPAPPTP